MSTAYAADWITHSALGGFLGHFTSPVLAFVIGFISHIILDIFVNEFKAFPVTKHWWWYSCQIVVVTVLLLFSPSNIVFGTLGAISPDIIDGIYGFFSKRTGGVNLPKGVSSSALTKWINDSNWNAGNLLFPFHRSEATKGKPLTLIQNIFLSLISLIALLAVQLKEKTTGGTHNDKNKS